MDHSPNNNKEKKDLTLPILALVFDFLPLILLYLSRYDAFYKLSSFLLLSFLLCPIIGLVIGVVALKQGKKRIGAGGRSMAMAAVVLPLIWIGLIVLFFTGVTTGMISFM